MQRPLGSVRPLRVPVRVSSWESGFLVRLVEAACASRPAQDRRTPGSTKSRSSSLVASSPCEQAPFYERPQISDNPLPLSNHSRG